MKIYRLLSMILSFVSVSILPVPAFAANGDMGGGDGSVVSPWLIEDLADFQEFAGNSSYWDDHTRMETDIDLAGIPYTTAVIAPDTSSLSGFQGTPFSGTFDGNIHTISNMTIDTAGADNDYLGLFGRMYFGEVINLGLDNVEITGGTSTDYLGGMCGFNDYSIINYCYSIGSVTGGNNSQFIGGLVGIADLVYSDISKCYTSGSVTGGINSSDYVGGLAGRISCGMTGGLFHCYSTASVTGGDKVGGLCGHFSQGYGYYSSCYFLNTAGPDNGYGTPLTDDRMKQQNSFIGWDFDPYDGDPAVWFMPINDYPILDWQYAIAYDGQTEIFLLEGESGAIQIDVYNRYYRTVNWTITGYESCSWITSLDPNSGSFSDPTDRITVTINIDSMGLNLGVYTCELTLTVDNLYSIVIPIQVIVYFPLLSGSGTQADPFLIENFNDFQSFSDSDSAFAYYVYSSSVYTRLDCDLDLNPNLPGRYIYTTAVIAPDTTDGSPFEGLSFSGVFDGNDHIISNLTIDTAGAGNDNLGLFGKIDGSSAEIKNLHLENVNINGSNYSDYVGGLCGRNSAGIIRNCHITGIVTGSSYLGGLCGRNYSSISYCSSTATINGEYNLGGLCGRNYSSIRNSYATGSVTGRSNLGGLCGRNYSSIRNSYATVLVTGSGSGLGGLCGRNYGSISNCYFLDSAGPDNGYGTPLTDAEMKQQNSFIGWDFDPDDGDPADWFMPPMDYPILFWQITILYDGQTTVSLAEGESDTIQIEVYSAVDETLNWIITGHEDCPWITSLDPNSGSSSGPEDRTTVTINVDSLGLGVGVYSRDLTLIPDSGYSITVPFSLQVFNRVDLEELSLLAKYWLTTDCDEEQPCSAADWYFDHNINLFDFNQLALSWLGQEINTVIALGWRQPSLLIPWNANPHVCIPYVTADKLTMYYSRYSSPNGYEIIEATRSDPRGSFTSSKLITELAGTCCPWLSENKLRLYYTEDDVGGQIIKIAERADLNSLWIPVRTVSEVHLPGYRDDRPAVTADELNLFWISNRPAGSGISSSIWTASRSSTSEPFSNVTNLNELSLHEWNSVPCILPDGLTIYFTSTEGPHPWLLYKATRNSLLEPFGNIQLLKTVDDVPFDSHASFVTPDEKDLYFYSEWMGQGEGIHVSYYE